MGYTNRFWVSAQGSAWIVYDEAAKDRLVFAGGFKEAMDKATGWNREPSPSNTWGSQAKGEHEDA